MLYFLKTKKVPFFSVNEAYEVEIAGTFLQGPNDLALVSWVIHISYKINTYRILGGSF